MATYDETPPDVFVSINITLTDPEAQTLRLATCGPVWHGDTDTQRDQVLIEVGNIPTGDGVDSQLQFKVKDVPLSVTIGIEDHTTDIPKVSKLLNLYDFAGATVKVWHGTRYTGGDFTTDQTWEGVIEGISAIDANSVTFMASSEGQIRSYQLPSKYIQDPTEGQILGESLGKALPVCLGSTQASLDRIAQGGIYNSSFYSGLFQLGATYMGLNPSFFPCLKGRYDVGSENKELKVYLGEVSAAGAGYPVETQWASLDDWVIINGTPARFHAGSASHGTARRDSEGWYYRILDDSNEFGEGRGPFVEYPIPLGQVILDDSANGDANKTVDGRWDTYSKLTAGTTQKIRWKAPDVQKIGNIRAKQSADSEGPAGVAFCVLHGHPRGVTPGNRTLNLRIKYHDGASENDLLDEIGGPSSPMPIALGSNTTFTRLELSPYIWLRQIDTNYPNPWYKNWQLHRVQEGTGAINAYPYMFEVDATDSSADIHIIGVCFLFGISLAQIYKGNDAIFTWGGYNIAKDIDLVTGKPKDES
jgi:hypothetical protein